MDILNPKTVSFLQKLTNTQKKSISKYSRYLCDLRTLATNVTNVLEVNNTDTNISTVNSRLDLLTECYANTSIVLEQFSVVLKSCPERGVGSESEPDFDSILSDSKIVRCYTNSDEWKDLNKRVNALISYVNKQKNVLYKVTQNMPKEFHPDDTKVPVISQAHIDVANDCKTSLESMVRDIDDLLLEYQFKFKSNVYDLTPQHPLLKSVVNLSSYLKETLNELESLDKNDDVSMDGVTTDKLIEQSEDLIATMLLIIQSVYKQHLPLDYSENAKLIKDIDEIIKTDKEESKDIVEDRHLKEHLQDKLSSDSRLLQLESLINKTKMLYNNYGQYLANGNDVSDVKSVVMRLVPILEQTVLFVQYFVSQKVAVHRVSCKMLSVLLKIFSDLAQKG